jgi:hypothetical protein
MKTGTSITEKRYNKVAKDLVKDLSIDLATTYIKRWTQQQLNKYAKQPVVIPINNHGFLVGHYKIQKSKESLLWSVQHHNGDVVKNFNNKQSAIYYCLCDIKRYYNLARDISNNDTLVYRAQSNMLCTIKTIDRARKKKDYFKVDVLNNKLIEHQLQFDTAKSLLEKSLRLAKYYKIWDEPS